MISEEENIIKDIKISEDNDALVTFLDGTMERATSLVKHFDTQINILVGISTALIALAVTDIGNGIGTIPFLILSFFSILSVIFGLYAVHPPKFMRKRGQVESLFYNKKIVQLDSPKSYATALTGILENKKDLIENYSTEVYNLYKYHYRPKRKLFKISRDLLVWGITLSSIAYIFIHLHL